jgi:hypothetical protein
MTEQELLDEIISATRSVREQAAMGQWAGANRALAYAESRYSAMPRTARLWPRADYLMRQARATLQQKQAAPPAELEEGRRAFGARVSAAQQAAAEETLRAKRGVWLEPTTWNFPSPGDAGDMAKGLQKLAILAVVLYIGIPAVMRGFRK